jgi:hypothetical protein
MFVKSNNSLTDFVRRAGASRRYTAWLCPLPSGCRATTQGAANWCMGFWSCSVRRAGASRRYTAWLCPLPSGCRATMQGVANWCMGFWLTRKNRPPSRQGTARGEASKCSTTDARGWDMGCRIRQVPRRGREYSAVTELAEVRPITDAKTSFIMGQDRCVAPRLFMLCSIGWTLVSGKGIPAAPFPSRAPAVMAACGIAVARCGPRWPCSRPRQRRRSSRPSACASTLSSLIAAPTSKPTCSPEGSSASEPRSHPRSVGTPVTPPSAPCAVPPHPAPCGPAA